MAKFSGKLINVGIAIEATPGAGGTPDVWFKWNELSFQNKVNKLMDESSIGNIVDASDSEVTSSWAEGSLGGNVNPISIGYLLYLIFGQAPVSTGAGPYAHDFQLLNSNSQQSGALTIQRPTDELQHVLSYVDTLTISAEIDGYVTVSTTAKGRKGVAVTQTATFIDEKAFVSSMLKLYIAPEGDDPLLDPNICLKSIELTMTREQEEDKCMSDLEMGDQITNKFLVTGSFEVTMEDSSDMDAYCNNAYKAMGIVIENTLGDKLSFNLPKVTYTNRTPAMALDSLTRQTIEFKGLYSVTESKAIECELINTQATY